MIAEFIVSGQLSEFIVMRQSAYIRPVISFVL